MAVWDSLRARPSLCESLVKSMPTFIKNACHLEEDIRNIKVNVISV